MSLALVPAMLCMLLGGCAYISSDTVIHDDGSLTLILTNRTDADEEDEETAVEDAEVDELTQALADEIADEVLAELDDETMQEMSDELDAAPESMYMVYTFRFDRPVRQVAGPTDAVVIDCDLARPTAEQAAQKAAGAVRSTQSLIINGEAAFLAPYNVGGNDYFTLPDLGAALGFGAAYDAASHAVLVTTK